MDTNRECPHPVVKCPLQDNRARENPRACTARRCGAPYTSVDGEQGEKRWPEEAEGRAARQGKHGRAGKRRRHKQKGDAVQSVAKSVDTVNREVKAAWRPLETRHRGRRAAVWFWTKR